jgi:transketolase
MLPLTLIPQAEAMRVWKECPDRDDALALLADICRLNSLTAVKRAGSGHLGSSFSAMDIVTFLLFEELNTAQLGFDSPDRDVYFSSKGHDVPGLYAALHALGVLPAEKLLGLRRLGGLDGHPNVRVPGVEANSGSLGMGISKGRGIAWAKRHLARGGRVVVMVGDGELQEGQNYEALQGAAHERLGGLTVVVDRNELQSDRPTEEIVALGDLEVKLGAFGWHVASCDGHDFAELRAAFAGFGSIEHRPQVLVAHTLKGRGVSFMEHPVAMRESGGTYRWHAGAPDDAVFTAASDEIRSRIDVRLAEAGIDPLRTEPVPLLEELLPAPALEAEPESGAGARTSRLREAAEYVVDAYGRALVDLADRYETLVVLDADLASDCRVRLFEDTYPGRFLECGIAEQDMVSAAAGLARHGLLPVVNSFASFLASRANEQIYNQASEGTKVIYALHYAGLIPAGPGMSHQSLRDISLLGALPGMTIVQPCNAEETRALLTWAVADAEGNVAMRLVIGPSPRRIELPTGGSVSPGRGVTLREGGAATLLSYGPVMLHEVLLAAESLESRGASVQVVSMPWLNRIDGEWLGEVADGGGPLFVVEDHASIGGLGDAVRRALPGAVVTVLGVEGWPAFGTPPEALRFHGLDGASLADRLAAVL